MSRLQHRFERWRDWLARANPRELDVFVRVLLIQYHFLCSDRQIVEVFGGESPRLDIQTPVSFKGAGRIRVHQGASFGVVRSPGNLGCSYVEARTADSLIQIDEGCVFNNHLVMIAEGSSIRFGKNCLVGQDVLVSNSNFHDLALARRRQPDPRPLAVEIGDDVFIGAKAIVMKGASIGQGSVIGAGAVLAPRFVAPPFSVITGNPARVVGTLNEEGEHQP